MVIWICWTTLFNIVDDVPQHLITNTSDLRTACASHGYSFSHLLSKLSGDAQSETGQSNPSHSTATPPHPPHQLPSLRLRLLARAGLRRPGDIGQVPAASRCVSSFRVRPRGSLHNGIQPHGTIRWIQPDRAPPKCQKPCCGGDISANVQEFYRSHPLTFRRALKKSREKNN